MWAGLCPKVPFRLFVFYHCDFTLQEKHDKTVENDESIVN